MFKFLLPGFNRYIVIGIILFIVGIFLTPFIIGIFIMSAGWLLMTFGFFYYYLNLFPFGKKIIAYTKALLIKYFNWYKAIFIAAFGKK